MEARVVVLSRCMGLTKNKRVYSFHFKGSYKGQLIKVIYLRTFYGFVKNQDYLLYLNIIEIKEGIIWADVLKMKSLDDIYY